MHQPPVDPSQAPPTASPEGDAPENLSPSSPAAETSTDAPNPPLAPQLQPPPAAPTPDDLRALQGLERTIAGRRSWLDGYIKRKEAAKAHEYIQQIQGILDENAPLFGRTADAGGALRSRTDAYLADARTQLESLSTPSPPPASQPKPSAASSASNALPPKPTPKPAPSALSSSTVLPPKPATPPAPSASSVFPAVPAPSKPAQAPKANAEALSKLQAAQRSLKNKRNWLDGNVQMQDFDKAAFYRDQLREDLDALRPLLAGEAAPLGGSALIEETEKYLQHIEGIFQRRAAATSAPTLQPVPSAALQPSALDVLLRKLNDLQSRIDGNIRAKELDRARSYHQQLDLLLEQHQDTFADAGDPGAQAQARYKTYLQQSAPLVEPPAPATSTAPVNPQTALPGSTPLDQIQRDLRRFKGWIDGNLRSNNHEKAKAYRDDLVQMVLKHATTLDAAGPPGHQLYGNVVAYIKHIDATLSVIASSQRPAAKSAASGALPAIDPLAELRKDIKKFRGWIDGNLRSGNLEKATAYRATLGQILTQQQPTLNSAGAAGQTLNQQVAHYLNQVDNFLKQTQQPAAPPPAPGAAPLAPSAQELLDPIFREFKKLCGWLEGNLRSGDLPKAKQYHVQISNLLRQHQATIERSGAKGQDLKDDIDAYLASTAAALAPPQPPPQPLPEQITQPPQTQAPSPSSDLPKGQVEYKAGGFTAPPGAAPSSPDGMTRLTADDSSDDDDASWSRPSPPKRPTPTATPTPAPDDDFDDWAPKDTKPPTFNANDFSDEDPLWSKRQTPTATPDEDDDWSPPPPPSNTAWRAELDDETVSREPKQTPSRWSAQTPAIDDSQMTRLVDDQWDKPTTPIRRVDEQWEKSASPPIHRMPLPPPGVAPPRASAASLPAVGQAPIAPSQGPQPPAVASNPPPQPPKPTEPDLFTDPSFGPDDSDSITWLNRVKPFLQPGSHLFIGVDASHAIDDIARAHGLIPQAQAILNMQNLVVFPDEPSPRLAAAMLRLKHYITRMPQTSQEAAALQHPAIHQAIDALEAKRAANPDAVLHPVEVFHPFDLINKLERIDLSLETGALRVRLFCAGIEPP